MDGQVDPYLSSSTSEELRMMDAQARMIRNMYYVKIPLWLVMRCNCERMTRYVALIQSRSRAVAHTPSNMQFYNLFLMASHLQFVSSYRLMI
jgi:hypothetical protein